MHRQAVGEGLDRGKPRVRRRVGLLEVVVAVLGYLAVSVAAGVVLSALGYDLASPGAFMMLVFSAVAAAAPVVAVGLALLPRVRSLAAVGLRGVSGRWLLAGAGAGLLGWAVNRGVILLYVWISGDAGNPQAGLANIAIGGPAGQFALLVLLAGLLAPFGEELLFRGVLFTWLRRWGFVLAAVLSSLAFGVVHGFNVVLPAAVVLGLLAAYLYERSGSILPAVVAHAVNNTFIFATARLAAELGLLDSL